MNGWLDSGLAGFIGLYLSPNPFLAHLFFGILLRCCEQLKLSFIRYSTLICVDVKEVNHVTREGYH